MTDAPGLEPQAFEQLGTEDLMGLRRVATTRTHEAKVAYEAELTKLLAINRILRDRRRPK